MEASPKHPKTARLFAALLATLDISASKLAREISTPAEAYSQQVISNYVSGKSKASETVLAAIARRYPAVSPMWLLTGEGQPFPDGRYNERARPTADPADPPAAPVAGLRVNRDGETEGYWQGVAGERLQRIESLEKTVERLWGQNGELLKKPEASADTASLREECDDIMDQYYADQEARRQHMAAQFRHGAVMGRWVSLTPAA